MAERITELLGRRTMHSKVFGLDDGTLQVEIHGRPIHYKDADDQWQDMDLTAVDDTSVAEFDAVYKKCFTPIRFSKSSKRPWRVRFGPDQWIIYRACDGRNSHAIIDGPTVLYVDAWIGADLKYTVLGHGVKEEIILKEPSASISYAFDVGTYGVNLQPDGRDGYEIIGSGGGIVALLPAPSAVDAIGAMGPATLVWDADTKRLTIAADPLWLANPARVWPVTLDPTTIQPNGADGKDTYITQWAGDANNGTVTPLRVGCETTGTTYNDRALIEFINALLEPYDDYNATVATADLYCSAEVNATDRIVDVFGILAAWGEMTATWNNQPAYATPATHSETITEATHWFSWDVLALVQSWLYTPATNMGMMFISQAEGITSSRKDFYSSDSGSALLRPRLVLTLNARPTATPTAPLGTAGAPGVVTDDVSPTFTWTYADTEANVQVGLQVRVYTDAGALVYDSGDVVSAVASYTIPANTLDYDVLYKWEVRVRDASGWSFYSGLQWFECLYSAPTGLRANNLFSANQADVEIGTTGFALVRGTETISKDTSEYYHGAASLKVITPGGQTNEGIYTTFVAASAATAYSAAVYVKGSGTVYITLQAYQSTTFKGQAATVSIALTGSWQQVTTGAYTTPALTNQIRIMLHTSTNIQAITFYADALCVGPANPDYIHLTWTAHPGEALAGYYIYRKLSTAGAYTLLTGAIIATNSYTDGACGSGVLYNYKVSATADDGYEGPLSDTSVPVEIGVTFTTWRLEDTVIKVRSISTRWQVLAEQAQLIDQDPPLVLPTRVGVLGDCAVLTLLAMNTSDRDVLKTLWASADSMPLRNPQGDVWVVQPVDELAIEWQQTGTGFMYIMVGTLQEVTP